MKLYIIDLAGHNVPDRAFSSKQEAVKAARAALKAECEEEIELPCRHSTYRTKVHPELGEQPFCDHCDDFVDL